MQLPTAEETFLFDEDGKNGRNRKVRRREESGRQEGFMYFLFNDLRVRQGFDPDMIFPLRNGSEPIRSHILITNSTSRLGF